MPNRENAALNRVQRAALLIGIVCLGLCGLGALGSPVLFLRTYLVAYSYWLGIALGSMAIVMVFHLTGGPWGLLIRRILESATRTLPLLVLLFAPLVLGMNALYQWTQADEVARDPVLAHKSLYLNVPAFLVRAAVYFAIWLLAAQPTLRSLISTTTCRDLGNLLLTVVMFWAYTAFAQFLLIWAGNLPEEIDTPRSSRQSISGFL